MVESIKCPCCKSLINLLVRVNAVSLVETVFAKKTLAKLNKLPVLKKKRGRPSKAVKKYYSHRVRKITTADKEIIKSHDDKNWKDITPIQLAKNLGVGKMQVAGVLAYFHRINKIK